MSHQIGQYFFTESHEWLMCTEPGVCLVGITDYAQALLGDIVFIDLPSLNETVSQGDECAVIESVKTAADIYAPVSGEILEVNEGVKDATILVNNDPYVEGWLFKMALKDEEELEGLFGKERYEAMVAEHKQEGS